MLIRNPAYRGTKTRIAALCSTSAIALMFALQAPSTRADDGGFRDTSDDLSVGLINDSDGGHRVATILQASSLLGVGTDGYAFYDEDTAATVVDTGFYTNGRALNADGTVLVGQAKFTADGDYHAFIWSAEDGFTDIGALVNGSSYAVDVSDDGTAVAGDANFGDTFNHAFFWTDAGGVVDLGTLGGSYSSAQAISADGSTVIGASYYDSSNIYHGFVWRDDDDGMTDIGTLDGGTYSSAGFVSNDGSVVVGDADNADGYYHAIRWTDDGGIVDLSTLGGSFSYARAMSDDGSVIVGYAQTAEDVNQNSYNHAFRWSVGADGINGTMTDLGTLGGDNSYAEDVNADGTVVVGSARDSDDIGHGFRWTEEDGMITVEQWLRDNGVTVADDFTEDALRVSDDGTVVVGESTDGSYYLARVTDGDTPSSGIISLPQYLGTIGSTETSRVSQPMSGANTIMFGAQGSPMRNILGAGQRSVWGTVDTGHDDNDASKGGLVLGDFGFGYGIADGITARISVGGTYTDQDLDAGGDFQQKGWYVSPEVSANIAGDVYLTVGGYYSSGKLDIQRGYLNGSVTDYSYGNTDTATWAGKIRLDWLNAFTLGETAFTPYAALSRANTRSDAYTETGGSFPASYDEIEDHSTIARLGVDLVHPLTDAFRLLARAETDYRFEKETAGTTGEIIGISSFALAGEDVKQFWLRGGIGGEFDVAGGTASLMLNATTEGSDPDVWLRSGWKMEF